MTTNQEIQQSWDQTLTLPMLSLGALISPIKTSYQEKINSLK